MTLISSPVMDRPRVGRASAIVAIVTFLPLSFFPTGNLANPGFGAIGPTERSRLPDASGRKMGSLLPTRLRPKVRGVLVNCCLSTTNATRANNSGCCANERYVHVCRRQSRNRIANMVAALKRPALALAPRNRPSAATGLVALVLLDSDEKAHG